MNSLTSYLPSSPGYLPYWLRQVSVVSVANSVQAYVSLGPTQQVYAATPSPVTPLSARTFGTWTLLSSVIRLYAAYDITNKPVYEIALASYGIAFAHFFSEWLVFGSTKWGKGLAGPAIVSTMTIGWMVSQKDFYVS
ncbi:ergosterol 28 [Microthyrium microscopicum]|uniref:Ergosterol 28 n=1 Tax=Microthyrium microscopicum TaxID=703497 RepID=A0A6A6UPE0_9PEZI|nr:ergosterol 28 [Microthyrium microscopicum]